MRLEYFLIINLLFLKFLKHNDNYEIEVFWRKNFNLVIDVEM